MLDIKFIRENKDLITEAAKKKRVKFDISKLIDADDTRKKLLLNVEDKRKIQNEVSRQVAGEKNSTVKLKLIEDMTKLKEELALEEGALKEVMKEWQTLMLAVPNIPDVTVPEGADESGNTEVMAWGEKKKFSFPVKDHVELMSALGIADFERGVKAHGFRGYFLKGEGAEISWALWNYARDFFTAKQFIPFVAPSVLRKEHFIGTGHLPREAEDLFRTQDDDYLSGTAEVAMMAYHCDETLKGSDLPLRYLAFSPCFRREAGSHGKDVKGLIRVHEFYKLEQLILSKADHADSERLHEEINGNFEEFLQSLGLPYRRLLICTGDLSQSKVKQYDTEVWMPSENAYRELSSASYYHDFQTRRFNIKYDDGAKKHYAYSLNCTAVATPRIIAAIVENYQEQDGSVATPRVLRQYMSGRSVIAK